MNAIRTFLIITILMSGLPWSAWLFYRYALFWRLSDPSYTVVGVVQRAGSQDQLKTAHLTELLQLSVDQPTNLYAFDLRKGEKLLFEKNIFKKLKIKRIKPGTLFVDYVLRTPLAFLGDYTNTALDEEGILFPFTPFFTPKKLPEIFLGQDTSFLDKNGQVALQLLKLLSNKNTWEGISVQRIDVSKMHATSYGQREIIILIEEKVEIPKDGLFLVSHFPRVLRLNPEDYLQSLNEYLELRKLLNQNEKGVHAKVIDLRVPQLAFIPQEYVKE